MKAQGLDRKKLVYHSNLQPYLSIWGVFWVVIFILINGFTVSRARFFNSSIRRSNLRRLSRV